MSFQEPIQGRRLAQCEQEKRELDFILTTAGAGTWKWNPDTDLVEVSGHLRELLGYSGRARSGCLEHWLGHVHPDDRADIRARLAAARDVGAAPVETELRLLAQDGSARWFAMRAAWQPQDGDQARLMLGACVDVDALKTAEAAQVRTTAELLRARSRFFHILDQMPSGVVLADVESGALTYRNRAATTLLAAEGDDLGTPLHFAGVAFADEAGTPVPAHELPLARTLSHGEALARDLIVRRRDGAELALAINSDLVRDADGTARLAIAVMHDVSERKRVALQLATEKERAQVTLAAIADGVIVTDKEGAITQMNPAAEWLVERCTDTVRGMPVSAVVRFEEQDAADALAAAIVDCQGQQRTISDLPHATLYGPDGRRCAVECAVAPIALPDGSMAGAVLVLHDVTEAKRLLRRLGFEASHDALTGLVNRREFEARLQRAITHASQPGGAPCALLYLDLDQFKVVNDTCGHAAGDELLRQLAGLYSSHVRERDTLARIGGDEFAMIVEHCDLPEALAVADKILDTTRSFRFSCKDRVFQPGVSIGLAPVDRTTASVEEAMRRADHACYIAKERGRNRVYVHEKADGDVAQRRSDMHWVTRLGHAFQHELLELYCQPIATLGGGDQHLHYEILLRMNDGAGAPISPGTFLPAAERYDVILEIDRWVLTRTLGWLASQPKHLAGLDMCSINLSRRSLGDASFHHFAADLIEKSDVPASKLCFEITENGAIADMHKTISFIERLAARGCRFSLDDFGTGMTSFACLKQLPVDFIKIDGSLIQSMLSSEVDYEMVRFTNDISHRMGRKTIAEYVTDPALAEHLGRIGVDFAQGYYIGKPRPLTAGVYDEVLAGVGG